MNSRPKATASQRRSAEGPLRARVDATVGDQRHRRQGRNGGPPLDHAHASRQLVRQIGLGEVQIGCPYAFGTTHHMLEGRQGAGIDHEAVEVVHHRVEPEAHLIAGSACPTASRTRTERPDSRCCRRIRHRACWNRRRGTGGSGSRWRRISTPSKPAATALRAARLKSPDDGGVPAPTSARGVTVGFMPRGEKSNIAGSIAEGATGNAPPWKLAGQAAAMPQLADVRPPATCTASRRGASRLTCAADQMPGAGIAAPRGGRRWWLPTRSTCTGALRVVACHQRVGANSGLSARQRVSGAMTESVREVRRLRRTGVWVHGRIVHIR